MWTLFVFLMLGAVLVVIFGHKSFWYAIVAMYVVVCTTFLGFIHSMWFFVVALSYLAAIFLTLYVSFRKETPDRLARLDDEGFK